MSDDNTLLHQYAREGSEDAFTELVSRQLPLVYSAALRQVGGDHHLAKEVAQQVFTDLARKAGSLARYQALTGWLYTSTRFAAAKLRRSEGRRNAREHIAAAMHAIDMPETSRDWEALAPVLDELMHELAPEDRSAVLLRYFEHKSLGEVGAVLGVSADAARMRLARALEKLHGLLTARGVTFPVATLAGLLVGNSVQAAPAGLGTAISATALATAAGGVGLLNVLLRVVTAHGKIAATLAVALAMVLAGSAAYVKTLAPRSAKSRSAETTPLSVGPNSRNLSEDPLAAAADPVRKRVLGENQMLLQLLEAETGDPIPAAKIRVALFFNGGGGDVVMTQTDSAGQSVIEFPEKEGVSANVFVTADAHVPKFVSLRPVELPSEYVMKLARGVVISGTVVDELQRPVSHASLTFQGPGLDFAQKENIQFGPDTIHMTEPDGRWSCNMIPREYETISVLLTHPDFAPCAATINIKKARGEGFVLQLTQGLTLTGVVTDSKGAPVRGAAIRQVHNRSEPLLSTKTDDSGRFELRHLALGSIQLAAQAAGLAPAVLETNVTANFSEVTFVLPPGQMLRGRVTDTEGAPIPKAVIRTDYDYLGLRKVEWSATTDGEGRFAWDSAPTDPLFYRVEARGFAASAQMALKADGTEQQLKLVRKASAADATGVEVSGTVVDERTGLPLDEFRVLLGEVRALPANPDFTFIADGKQGKFTFPLRQAQLFPMYQVRIDKEGYLPLTSTNLMVKNGNRFLELKLQKGSGPSGVVVLPDGELAVNATVFLCCEGLGAVYMDQPAQVRKEVSTAPSVQTDAAGRFAFPARPQQWGLIAVHDQGYAEIRLDSFAGVVPLQPWGRVRGKIVLGGQPQDNQMAWLCNVMYRCGRDGRPFPALSLWLQTQTDVHGEFVFEKVPPGERRLSRRLTTGDNNPGRIFETHGTTITVLAGQETRVDIGGSGRLVIGKVVPSGPASGVEVPNVMVGLQLKIGGAAPTALDRSKYPTREAFLEAQKVFADGYRAFWTSEEGRSLERSQRNYFAFCQADGSFELPDVLPGPYTLTIEAPESRNSVAPSSGAGAGWSLLFSGEVVVSEAGAGAENTPVDLGFCQLGTGKRSGGK